MAKALPLLQLTSILCCVFAPANLRAEAPGDSLAPKYTLSEIVVTATRTHATSASVPSSVTLVQREDILLMPGRSLSAALAEIPGLGLRSYGGGASVQSLSIRGMSPEHTLVLVDGLRYNSYQNGLTDFGILPALNVQRIEVVRGGYSALYGADAVGGVVNVITQKPPDGFTASLDYSLGSFGFSAQELKAGATEGAFSVQGVVRRERARGDYPFTFSDGSSTVNLKRQGNDYSVLYADLRADWNIDPALRAQIAYTHTDAERGSPGEVTDASSSGGARLSDQMGVLRGDVDWTVTQECALRLRTSLQGGLERYSDPHLLVNGSLVNSSYTNRALSVSPEALFGFSPLLSGVAGFEFVRASLVSDETNDARRIQTSAYVSTEHTISLPWEIPFEVILYPSLRYDSYSDVEDAVSPRIGMNVGLLQALGLRVRASYAKSFHAPVLNDLYWKVGGNPALKPERAHSFDTGMLMEVPVAGALQIVLSYFAADVNDKIVWVPSSATLWSPTNIASVRSRGVEAEASWTGLRGALTLAVNSTWMDVRKTSSDFPGDPTEGKRLIYVPEQTVHASATLRVGHIECYLRHSWFSYRFTTEVNDHFLPSYGVTAAAVRTVVSVGPAMCAFKLEADNIFNTSYEVIALYPMPLREIRGTVGVTL